MKLVRVWKIFESGMIDAHTENYPGPRTLVEDGARQLDTILWDLPGDGTGPLREFVVDTDSNEFAKFIVQREFTG